MLRLATPGYLRFNQAKQFEATFGGGEANVAVSLANYGLEAEFVTRFPKNDIAESCIKDLHSYGVGTKYCVFAVSVSESTSLRQVLWHVQARSFMTVHTPLSQQ